MPLLTRERIEEKPQRRYITVKIPCSGWEGEEARLQSMMGHERDAWEASNLIRKKGKEERDNRNFRARCVAWHLVDEKNKRIYNPHLPADVRALGSIDGAVVDFLFFEGCKLSGITDDDVAEMEENLDDDPSEDSTSV